MARKTKITAGILNVRLHPHSVPIYLSFLEDLFRLKEMVRIHGDRHAMLSFLDREKKDDGIIEGVVTTFTSIDVDGEWFDATGLSIATDEQVSEVNIPNSLYPNSSSFYFLFNANNHRLYVQTYSKGRTLSIRLAQKLFSDLSLKTRIATKYGAAKITIVQDKAKLDDLFALPVIKDIEITILKPNADIFDDDFEEKIEAHLAEAHSRKLTIKYEADQGKSIKMTPGIRRASEAALENGSVEVKGRDRQGAAVVQSTEDFPREIQERYDPDEVGEKTAFERAVTR